MKDLKEKLSLGLPINKTQLDYEIELAHVWANINGRIKALDEMIQDGFFDYSESAKIKAETQLETLQSLKRDINQEA